MDESGSAILERPTADTRSLSELVASAGSGHVRLPRFQRPFRWGDRDVLALFDSLRRGFPIGSLLLWERSAPEGPISFGSLEVQGPRTDRALWVVDGQQRLTSLVASLTPHRDVAHPFEVFFDLEDHTFVRRGGRHEVPVHWLPLSAVLDTNRLLDTLMERRADGLSSAGVDAARALATTIAEYRVPLFIVKTEDENVLREIFARMNTAGAKMTSAEVFRALHASFEPGDDRDLGTLIDRVATFGFGTLREDTVLRCVLAVRGGDVYRSFEHEFGPNESPATTFEQTARALQGAFAFLRTDAAIPHVRALPYAGVLPVLTRFFALHPEPEPRIRTLLRRWIWRGSMGWGRDVSALRRAVQDISTDADASVARLLGPLRADEPLQVDLDAVQLNKAAARMNIALLSALHPIDLLDGGFVDASSLLEDEGAGALFEIVSGGRRLAGRVLHRGGEIDFLGTIAAATTDALWSHAISEDARAALLGGDTDRFLSLREQALEERLGQQRNRLAEPGANDRPAIASLRVSDD